MYLIPLSGFTTKKRAIHCEISLQDSKENFEGVKSGLKLQADVLAKKFGLVYGSFVFQIK